MRKHIDAEALVAFLRNARKNLPLDVKDFQTRDEMLLNFQQYVEMMPVVYVKQGEWLTGVVYIDEENVYTCSVCAEPFIMLSGTPKDNKYNYCPHCGAKMA